MDGDLTRLDLVEQLRGVACCFHLAAQAGVRASWGRDFDIYLRCNIEATQKLLEAARQVQLPRLVYSSSSSVYGNARQMPMSETARPQPVSPYGVTKLSAEQLCDLYHYNYGLSCVSLRYFTVYGPRQRPDMAFHRFIRAGLDGQSIEIYGDGEQTRDFVFVDDVVHALVLAADRGEGERYLIGTGQQISIQQLFRALAAATDYPHAPVHAEPRPGDVRHSAVDAGKAARDLGWKPWTTLEEGLAATLAWAAHKDDQR